MDQEYYKRIRNFCIIAHVDHGKSTLADRFLELTGTIEKRKMQPQALDRMDLERERGITIKMQPVRMKWGEYILNLIDTPGHVDFSYEVSRALAAVEGAILLVDATQGVQAQTVAHLAIAQKLGKTILAAINKIDTPHARIEETEAEIRSLLGPAIPIFRVSAKTGEGVGRLLEEVICRIPQPAPSFDGAKMSERALIFDSHFHPHSGVVAHVRVSDGIFEKGIFAKLFAARLPFHIKEVGVFTPDPHPVERLSSGEIGYIATGIREPGKVMVGDTIVKLKAQSSKFKIDERFEPLPGYQEPKPMIWLSVFPVSQKDFSLLSDALAKLRLTDSAFSYSQEANDVLGKGFQCGFLGLLHSEIIIERLKREFRCDIVVSLPSIAYEITAKNGEVAMIKDASRFPDTYEAQSVKEPWLSVECFTPAQFLPFIQALVTKRKGEGGEVETLTEGFSRGMDLRVRARFFLPLRVFLDNFFDDCKRVSEGYASLAYEMAEFRPALLTRFDVMVNGEKIAGLSRVVATDEMDRAARRAVERLHELLPRQLFAVKVQAVARGRIVASATVSALRKDVTGYLYGGDRSRKMKLWQKQKKGKKRLLSHGRIAIPPEVFIKMAQ